MAHFARINDLGFVTQVIVVHNDEVPDEQTGIQFCKQLYGHESVWVQTSYNASFRRRFAGIGDYYNSTMDIFIKPKPYPSWIFDMEDTLDWVSPIGPPPAGLYLWDEENRSWVESEFNPE